MQNTIEEAAKQYADKFIVRTETKEFLIEAYKKGFADASKEEPKGLEEFKFMCATNECKSQCYTCKQDELLDTNTLKPQLILNKHLNGIDISEANDYIIKAMIEFSNLRVANQIPNKEEFPTFEEWIDEDPEFKKAFKMMSLHRQIFINNVYDKRVAENISGVSNTKTSDAVEFADFILKNSIYKDYLGNNTRDNLRWIYKGVHHTAQELYTEFLKSKGITPVEKDKCKCHISEGVTMHTVPCCEETNKKH